MSHVLEFRDDIDGSMMVKLQAMPYYGYTIHSDWIELIGERSTDLSGKVLFPDIDYSGIKQIYPGLFDIMFYDEKNYTWYSGMINAEGTMLIPMKYINIEMDGNGIITCKGKESTDVYTYEGRKVCSLPPITERQFVFIRYNKDYQVLECQITAPNASVSKYEFYYLDGTMVTEPFEAEIMNFHGSYIDKGIVGTTSYKRIDVADYSPQVHSEQFLDAKKFMLPIRKSVVNNRWVKNAVKNCDEKKWEEALFDIYYFNFYEYGEYMQNVPECLLIASLWLKCQEELNDTEAIRQNYENLIKYNLWYDEIKEEVGVTYNAEEFADSKVLQQFLEECRAILNPILIPNYVEKMAKLEQEKKERKELAEKVAKEAKAKKKEEVRQRRAVIWTALLAGLGQALQNMGTAYANSLNTGGKSSAGVSSVGGGASVSSPSSSSSSSSSSNSSSSSQPKEVHEKCRVCDGSGIIYDSRIKGPDVKKKCPACDGRGYKIRYTSK